MLLEQTMKLCKFVKDNFKEKYSPSPTMYGGQHVDIVKDEDKLGLRFSPSAYNYVIQELKEKKFPFEYIDDCGHNLGLMIRPDLVKETSVMLEELNCFRESMPILGLHFVYLDHLKSLKGCPKIVKRFTLRDCGSITSLKYMPEYIVDDVYLSNLRVKKLPKFESGNEIHLRFLDITSLEGISFRLGSHPRNIRIDNINNLHLDYFPECDDISFTDCTFSCIDGLKKFPATIRYNSNCFIKFNDFYKFVDKNHLWR